MKIRPALIHSLVVTTLCLAFAAQAQLRVGVSAPLSGDLAEYGAAVRNGIEFARTEDRGSFDGITFHYEDNRYEAAAAISAFHKLRKSDAVQLIYHWGEPPLHAVAPLAEQAELPLIAMSLDPAPAIGRRFVIRSINFSDQYAETLAEHLIRRGFKRIAILKTEDPFLNSMVDGLRRHLASDQSLEVVAAFSPADLDFKTQITKLKGGSFDVLGVYLFTGQVSTFYRQAAALRLVIPTFGTDFFESRNEIAQARGAMNGAVYPNLEVPEEFAASYRERFGNDAQIAYAYNAYIFAKLTAQLFAKDKSLDTLNADRIVNRYTSMEALRNQPFRFRETAEGGRFYEFPLVIRKIEKDRFVTIRE